MLISFSSSLVPIDCDILETTCNSGFVSSSYHTKYNPGMNAKWESFSVSSTFVTSNIDSLGGDKEEMQSPLLAMEKELIALQQVYPHTKTNCVYVYISVSKRFGLTISFSAAGGTDYLWILVGVLFKEMLFMLMCWIYYPGHWTFLQHLRVRGSVWERQYELFVSVYLYYVLVMQYCFCLCSCIL